MAWRKKKCKYELAGQKEKKNTQTNLWYRQVFYRIENFPNPLWFF